MTDKPAREDLLAAMLGKKCIFCGKKMETIEQIEKAMTVSRSGQLACYDCYHKQSGTES